MASNPTGRLRQRVKVLLVEDDEDDYLITQDLLAEIQNARFDLDWVTTYEAAIEKIEENRHDVILMDYRLGKYTGLELLAEAIELGCLTPIILLTGQGGYEVDIAASETGAADYLVKSQISAALLEKSIRYAIKNYQKAEELQEQLEQLKERLKRRSATGESRNDLQRLADTDLEPLEEAIKGLRGLVFK
ncbi:MAG TPA: response regulator [Candidatus Caenarcaniphilales bacterium]